MQRRLTALLSTLCLCCLLLAQPAVAQEGFQQVPFDAAMKQQLNRSLPLTLGFPQAYEQLVLEPAIHGVVWGMPDELAVTAKTRDVPAKGGFFHGRLTVNAGYDRAQGLFICGANCTEADIQRQLSSAGAKVKADKVNANGIPVLFLEVDLAGMPAAPVKRIYMCYIATLIDTNVFLISYRPAPDSPDQGAGVWAQFRRTLEASR